MSPRAPRAKTPRSGARRTGRGTPVVVLARRLHVDLLRTASASCRRP